MSAPDGNPIDILCIVMALLATLVRLLRMLASPMDREHSLDVARLISCTSCPATLEKSPSTPSTPSANS